MRQNQPGNLRIAGRKVLEDLSRDFLAMDSRQADQLQCRAVNFDKLTLSVQQRDPAALQMGSERPAVALPRMPKQPRRADSPPTNRRMWDRGTQLRFLLFKSPVMRIKSAAALRTRSINSSYTSDQNGRKCRSVI